MTLNRLNYTVYVVDPDDPEGHLEHQVEVRAVDRLKAELEAAKNGLPDARRAPQNTTALWLWCALARTNVLRVEWRKFRDEHLLDFEPAKGVDAEAPPDPTTADLSASPSSSPLTLAGDLTTG